ncbi:glycoside hydrolase family 2 protein [Croceimicrobium sp.]|uniref:glycoside hydrolase family 2 protein n=1 Tax=Croceimicrobium sp. TaxID=2828340 RepID=UPI003BA949C0
MRHCTYIIFYLISMVAFAQEMPLSDSWQFRRMGESEWLPAQVPGTVHQDLMREQRIENIYFENNEHRYQWIEKENWQYQCRFNLKEGVPQNLVFDGLDTYARVYLDDSLLGECDNMFRRWVFDLSELRSGEHNLRVDFISPYQYHKKTLESYPRALPAGSETGDLKVSPFSRKAAYHFGWDWAPRIVTCGIYRKVYLQSRETRIQEVRATLLAQRGSAAFVQFDYTIENENGNLSLEFQGQRMEVERGPMDSQSYLAFRKRIDQAELWWPRGYGKAHLYYDTLKLFKDDSLIDVFPFRYGLRKVELVNAPDSLGTSFYFKINGKPIFARGANYVPQDMLLPRVSDASYRRLLNQAASANMNMLRVWGGGVYEKDLFYDLCDSLGIMVWQDFMFAGTMYPADQPGFLSNVKAEVEDNVKRLRQHPSIVLWCGNNEIDVAWKNWGWQKQFGYSKEDSLQLIRGYESLFKQLIPETLTSLDNRPYVHTSPLSNWGTAENFKHASMHYWGVWHGRESFDRFNNNVGRFMVEYGFQSFPDYKSLRRVIPDSSMYLESEAMQNRQKSYIGNAEILRQVLHYYGEPKDFKDFIDKSQAVQRVALQTAVRAHRMQRGFCMGSLMWQLNDCWPGPSWSVIDYYGREKPGLDALRNAFRQTFWYVEDGVIYFSIEEDQHFDIRLRFKPEDGPMISPLIQRDFKGPGTYQLPLRELPESQGLMQTAELKYIEIFPSEI